MMNKIVGHLVISILLFVQVGQADFSDIDLIVRESVEDHFNDYGKWVDLDTFSYVGEPKWHEESKTMIVTSQVLAEQNLIHPYQGWFDCYTEIKVPNPGEYHFQSTSCFFSL